MSNRILARIDFAYQGQTHTPTASLDLDALMAGPGQLPDLYLYLAQHNGIDTYSYLYEVMESHEIQFSDATGLAAECLQGHRFDIARFEQLWRNNRETAGLARIAREQLGVADLEAEPRLKQALLAAYRLGTSLREQ